MVGARSSGRTAASMLASGRKASSMAKARAIPQMEVAGGASGRMASASSGWTTRKRSADLRRADFFLFPTSKVELLYSLVASRRNTRTQEHLRTHIDTRAHTHILTHDAELRAQSATRRTQRTA